MFFWLVVGVPVGQIVVDVDVRTHTPKRTGEHLVSIIFELICLRILIRSEHHRVYLDASILISPSHLRAFNLTRTSGGSSWVCVWRGDGIEIVPLFLFNASLCLLNFFSFFFTWCADCFTSRSWGRFELSHWWSCFKCWFYFVSPYPHAFFFFFF